MNDLIGLTHSFQEWGALLDFLASIKPAKDVNDITIERGPCKEWKINLSKTAQPVRKPVPRGAAIYDLYW